MVQFETTVRLTVGETYNGHLVNCDNWMNINLKQVVCTSADGEKFWKIPEIYIRGNTVKYMRAPDEVIDKVKSDWRDRLNTRNRGGQQSRGGQRGGRGGQQQGRGGYSGDRGSDRSGKGSDRGGRGGSRGGRGGNQGGRGGSRGRGQ